MRRARILIAEDDELNRENLRELLETGGYDVRAVEDGQAAMAAVLEEKYDLIITDLKMPNVDGLKLLKYAIDLNPESTVIMVTGYGSVDTAVEAMKFGAFDYITKPLKDDLVKLTVERALSFARLKEENTSLKGQLRRKYDFGNMIGYSDNMKQIFDTIEKVAASDSTVIIYGESGTGKSWWPRRYISTASAAIIRLSRLIAELSPRSSSRASCSATRRGPLRARPGAGWAALNWRTGARFSSTK